MNEYFIVNHCENMYNEKKNDFNMFYNKSIFTVAQNIVHLLVCYVGNFVTKIYYR